MIKSILAALSAIAFVGATAFAQDSTAPAPTEPTKTTKPATEPKKGKKGHGKKKKTSALTTKSENSKG